MSDFSLVHEVRAAIRDYDLPSPNDIAAKVLDNIPDELLREALAQALPTFVRIQFHHQQLPDRSSNASAKVAAIRAHAEAWRKALRKSLNVGDGEWRFLADCSYQNLCYLAAERRRKAVETMAVADTLDEIAAAVKKHKVSRVGDLPEPVLAELLNGEEAVK